METDRNRISGHPNRTHIDEAEPLAIDDLKIRLWCIPAFGIVIPNLTGTFGHLGVADWQYWLGYPYFVALSFLLWQGNRAFLFRQRAYYDWFSRPAAKVIALLFANIFYTAPLSVSWMALWYVFAGFPEIDWVAVRSVALINVICVIFITHIYETVILIQERRDDQTRVADLERARSEAELAALKSQIDPHFLFNSLNTMGWLIEQEPKAAALFNDSLADMYRYILTQKDRALVSLRDELDFLNHYVSMLRLRFGDALQVDIPAKTELGERSYLPPISLQVLVENAVKHNEFSEQRPLNIRLGFADDHVLVSNPIRPRLMPRPSSGTGLRNLDERCRLLTGRGITVDRGEGFTVQLPLVGQTG